MMLSDVLPHMRAGLAALNRHWHSESLRRALILIVMLLLLIALTALVSFFTPMGNAG